MWGIAVAFCSMEVKGMSRKERILLEVFSDYI